MSECRGRKDHEGKTSGSILHGLVFAHEFALLVNLCIHDTKKNPVDALDTLRNSRQLTGFLIRWSTWLVYQNRHENSKIENINENCEVKKSKLQVEDLKIWDLTRIYDSDRISGATDKGMTTKAHGVGTPEVCSGRSP
jgi:hypothetical protein